MNTHKTYTVEEATQKLMHFCAYRERCHQEVHHKLQKLRMIPEAREVITFKLIQQNYLNEERFAKTFARDKFRLKKWGKYRITRELKHREISAYLIDKALLEIDEKDYIETFLQLLNKRLNSISEPHPLKKKKKIVDYLLRKGYESALIYDNLPEL